MKRIELTKWEPVPGKPNQVQEVGGCSAQEVFAELYGRLESTGYLPDEYFLLDSNWNDGKEIPKGADIFCTVDYGASEGIYLDIYLKWYEDKTPITKSFATGKTLGESGYDLDRMNLIASAVTKAFHSDGVHARYVMVGGTEQPQEAVLHLNDQEQRTLIRCLIDKRTELISETSNIELLLRRVTGSITEYINEVGETPMYVSPYDKAVLAIHDGSISAFKEALASVPDRTGDLLEIAAKRPGNVGQDMTYKIVADAIQSANKLPYESYKKACLNAVSIGDEHRVRTLAHHAEHVVSDLDMSLYGDIISEAMSDHKNHIAKTVLKERTPEQIKAANPHLLIQAIWNKSNIAYDLAAKGIDANPIASDVIQALANDHREYSFGTLLGNGLNISADNYSALHSCIQNNSAEMGKELLDRGMDFSGYIEWYRNNGIPDNDNETYKALKEHWENEINAEQDEGFGQTMT